MRKFSKLFAGVATMATAAALVAGTVTTASADPIGQNGKPVTPQIYDFAGGGSDTTQYVIDQISLDYNKTVKTHNAQHPYFYSWDAVPPGVNKPGNYTIKPKQGCAVIPRPNGSSSGVKAMDTSQRVTVGKASYWCMDFARSSGGRKPTDPKAGPGGIVYVAFAKDVVTWATRAPKYGGTNAPASLTYAQLKSIFSCKTTNWSQVGGKAGAIKVYLPQPGSGTLSFWEKIMGITTLGSCVSQAPEENEGTNPVFNNANAIFIFSIGSYIAQKYHSAFCNARPAPSQNRFGCNATGRLQLMVISGVSPTTSAKIPVTNLKFPATFHRTLYNVVRWGASTPDHIDGRLEKLISAKRLGGYICSSPVAAADIQAYGFIPTVQCGSIS